MANLDDTIVTDSQLGQRLSKIQKTIGYKLFYNGQSFPIVSEITIGRSQDNHIVIDDSLTSRYHAVFQKIKEDYFIKDLGSSNGTFVNGMKVTQDKYAKVNPGDKILVGRIELKLL